MSKQSARTKVDQEARLNSVANSLLALECVSKIEGGYKVTMPRIGKYESSFEVIGGFCSCGQYKCEHQLSAELFAAQQETEDHYNNVTTEYEYYIPTPIERVANRLFRQVLEGRDECKDALSLVESLI